MTGCTTSALFAALVVGPVLAAPPAAAADPLPPLTVTDLAGQVHDPFAAKDTVAVVFVFISPDCPIANFYQPTLRRIAARFSPQGVTFFQVHPDPALPPAVARKHAREFAITCPVVIDDKQALVRRLDAKRTPEVFVLTRDLTTVYRGRIDDTYATYGKRRPEPTTHDLADALTAVIAGKPVAVAATDPVGCHILVEDP